MSTVVSEPPSEKPAHVSVAPSESGSGDDCQGRVPTKQRAQQIKQRSA